MSVEEHKRHALKKIKFAIVVTTDTRDENSDESGKLMKKLIEKAGYSSSIYFVKNDENEIKMLFEKLVRSGSDIIIFSGGTGISPKDVTVDTIRPLLEKELPGFGELFRYMSMKEIGSAAMLSRACGGMAHGKLIFCIPGSPNAAKLAMEKLILKEAGHMLYEVRK